jgi:hemerythrin-like domain-containing protein
MDHGMAASFEHPFEMLTACHERVLRMLSLLARLRAHVREHGADDQARQAATDVMRYFDTAAVEHHRDEELHVFPLLITRGDPALAALVARLQQDHLQMESRWVPARDVLARLAAGRLPRLTPEHEALLAAFAEVYEGHIEAEERVAYPAAQALVAPPAVAAMGREMARRRGAI